MTCILIDDEPHARETLEDYLSRIPGLELKGSFQDASGAIAYLQEHSVDLVFSDISMPEMSGTDFLRSLQSPPLVVFVTAHSDFAVEGFELDVLDYIVKPYSFSRLDKAVNKAHEYLRHHHNGGVDQDCLKIKDRNKTVLLKHDDIHYIEAMKDYVRIINADKTIVTMCTMKELERTLPGNRFMRIQKSYIINIEKIRSVDKIKVVLKQDNKEIPIGLQYRSAFFKKINIQQD